MTIKENDKPHLRQLIKEIGGCRGYSESEHGFEFVIRIENIKLDNELISTVKDRRDLMIELEKLEAIKILETKLPEFGMYPFSIRILQPKFDEIFKALKSEFTRKLEPILTSQKSKNKKIIPFDNIPEGTGWENIEIKFKTRDDVEIKINETFLRNSNNEEMGFFKSGTKDKLLDKQWKFLQHLSTYVNSPSIQPTIDTVAGALKINKDNCMKIKGKLSKGLKEIFGIKDEPFRDYEETKYYKTKFKLTPETLLRSDGEVRLSSGRYNENIEYLKEEEDY